MKKIFNKLKALSHSRLNRVRYINYTTLTMILGVICWFLVTSIFIGVTHNQDNGFINFIGIMILFFVFLATVIPLAIFTIARCHDFNKSGWFTLLILIPFAYLFFMLLGRRNEGNRFGSECKANSTVATVFAVIIAILSVLGSIQSIIDVFVLIMTLTF